jgi:predicted DsbA family dithiol-disulfide isomerase
MFSDIACELCPRMIPRLRELHDAYPDDVRITLRLLTAPGRPELRDAEVAVVASAGEKGSWRFVERVYRQGGGAGRDELLVWAAEAGLDAGRIKAALVEPAHHLVALSANRKEAERVEAASRPCLFVQGRMLPGAAPLSMLKRKVSDELMRQRRGAASP